MDKPPMATETKLERVRKAIARSQRLQVLSTCANITAIDRLKINDHGPTHVRIVTRIALRILELLHGAGVKLGVTDHGLGWSCSGQLSTMWGTPSTAQTTSCSR